MLFGKGRRQQLLSCVLVASIVVISTTYSHSAKAVPSQHGPSGTGGRSNVACIISVPNRSTVLDANTVLFPDGSVHTYSSGACDGSTGPVPTINGWFESARGSL